MDQMRRRLKAAIDDSPHWTMATLSKAAGKNHAYLQQFIERGTPKKLDEDVRAFIASRLDISESVLGGPERTMEEEVLFRTTNRPPRRDVEPGDVVGLYAGGHSKVLAPGALAEMELRSGAGAAGYPLPTEAQDGAYSYAAEVVRAEWVLPPSYVRDELRVQLGHAEIIAVEGSSMEPDLRSGDRVIVNRLDRNIRQGGIFAVREGEGVIVKHVELIRDSDPPRIRCKSSNPHYEPFELVLDESNDIIGRVVWRGTRM